MKSFIALLSLLIAFSLNQSSMGQLKRPPASAGRPDYVEVEKDVKLHVTDLGEGQPIVLIHGWPLNNAMYEYQYQYLVQKGFRVIGISLRGFGKSDRPYGRYDFDVFSDDIKVVLEKKQIKNAVLGRFSMGGAVVTHYMAKYSGAHFGKGFGASETSIPAGMSGWLASISNDASPFATTEAIIALRDLDLRAELVKIKVP